MISLNGVTLSEDFLWINRYSEPDAILSSKRFISGNSLIQKSPLSGGKIITFGSVAVDSGHSGWWTKLEIEAIKALEISQEIVTFVYESEQFQVIVVPSSINVEPLIPRPNSADTDKFVGTVSLITI